MSILHRAVCDVCGREAEAMRAAARLAERTRSLQAVALRRMDRLRALTAAGRVSPEAASLRFHAFFATAIAPPLTRLRAEAEDAARRQRGQRAEEPE